MTPTWQSAAQGLVGDLRNVFGERLRSVVAYGPRIEGHDPTPLTCLALVSGHDISDRRRRSARFEKSFPQVEEMTLNLRFAGPAQIGLCDGDAVERVAAVDALMSADDLSVFQRERVE